MKCYEIQSFGLDGLVRAERPDPVAGPGQVLVAPRAWSLNFRDLLMVQGHYNPRLAFPRIPLSDMAGDVVAVGEGVRELSVGDRVASCFFQAWDDGQVDAAAAGSALGGEVEGVLAERVVLEEHGVVPLPEHLSYQEGATLPCAALTAWNALFEGPSLEAGQQVLVLGSGGVSVFALQLAHAAGARVIATSSSDAKLKRLTELGASDGVNYKETPEWHKRVLELTDRTGVDYVVEVGGAGTLPRSLKAVRFGGQIALIGVLAGVGEFDPLPAVMKGVTVRGIFVGSRAMFLRMNAFLSQHQLHPVIDRVFAMDEVRPALEHLAAGAHFGKVVLEA